jgi:ribosome-binding protein aMBF1 (putative translation factor)
VTLTLLFDVRRSGFRFDVPVRGSSFNVLDACFARVGNREARIENTERRTENRNSEPERRTPNFER